MFVSVVASPENACVEGKSHDGGNVGSLDGTLGRVFAMVPANVGVVERIAGGLDVHRQGVCWLLLLPVVDEGVNRIDESVLWD